MQQYNSNIAQSTCKTQCLCPQATRISSYSSRLYSQSFHYTQKYVSTRRFNTIQKWTRCYL